MSGFFYWKKMLFGSVCSGIEAASVAFNPLGWKAAWLAEIEPFPSAVLAHHYPDVPNLGDMTKIAARIRSGEIPAPDVFCGGTPCQAFSVAGLRKSLDDARGNLSLTFCEIANEIDSARSVCGEQPSIVFWENVPGVLNTKDNAFGCFLAGLAGEDDPLVAPGGKWTNAGAVLGPKRAVAWRVLDAQYFGVAQRRRRVFVVASARNGFDPTAVLFEFESVRRDTAPSRQPGQSAAAGTLRSTDGGSDVDHARAGHIQPVAATLTASFGRLLGQSGQDADHGHSHLVQETAHTLRGEGFDASEDGTGRGTPMVPVMAFNPNQEGMGLSPHFSPPIGASNGGGNQNCIAFDTTQITSATNRCNPKPGDPCHPLAAGAHAPAIAFPANLSGTQFASTENLSPALGAMNPTAVAFSCKDYGADAAHDIAPTMRAMGHAGSHPNAGGQLAVAIQDVRGTDKAQNGRGWNDDGAAYTLDTHATQGVAICGAFFAGQGAKAGSIAYRTDIAPTLKASDSGTNRTPSVHINTHPVAFQPRHYSDRERMGGEPSDVCHTLSAQAGQGDSSPHIASNMQVRRLTPTECEFLQGFPRGYTQIPWRKKPASECPDGPRYKAIGNSWAVPVVAWIARRIHQQIST